MSDLEQSVKEIRPDIIALTEIKPKYCRTPLEETEIVLEGYHPPLHNLDAEGRGVCIYVSSELGVEAFNIPSVDGQNFKESVWVKVKVGVNKTIVVGCVYRSPSSDSENNRNLENLLRCVTDLNPRETIVVGDFNYPNIDWDNVSATDREHSDSDQFTECVRDCYLIQHVDQPTRYRGQQRPSLLDLVLTSEENVIKDIQYLAPLGNSDHCTLSFEYTCKADMVHSKTTKYKYDKGDYRGMCDEMQSVDWESEMEGKDTQEAWDVFSGKLENAMQDHIPTHTVNNKPNKKRQAYMDRQGMKLLKAKQRKWQKYTETRDCYDHQKYCQARNKLRTHTRQARQNFEEAIAIEAKQNPKAFWKYTTSKLTVKNGVSDLKDNEGVMHSEDKAKAGLLNDFFCSVFTNEDISNVPSMEDRSGGAKLTDLHISEEDILKRLHGLKASKSAGPDGFHPRVLKEIAASITTPLKLIFSKSLESGDLPYQWKQGQVTPIFKKGDRSSPGNYRPVSLTSVLCKTLESIIREAVMSHMTENKLFCDEQHGFVPGRSCMTQLLVCLDEWTEALDRGDPLDTVYLDFQKAFDTVPHERLANKLDSYGIKGPIAAWIRSFLHERTQRVSLNGHTSDWSDVTSGIPQGSVLGPVLFVVFINDLPNAVSSVTRIFADDTKVFGSAATVEDRAKLQDDIESLSNWSDQWLLKFNTSKCSVMHLGQNNPHQIYNMRDNEGHYRQLEETEIEKDLGLHIDSKLTFHQHVNQSVNKANRVLGMIKRTFVSRDNIIIKRLFTTMVRPILEYGNAPRIHQFAGDMDRSEKVQRRATKLCRDISDLPYEERLRRLKLPSLYYRRERGDMIQAFKILTGQDRIDDQKLLPRTQERRTRGHDMKLGKRRGRLNIRKHSFGLRVVNGWNALPDWVVSAKDINSFKDNLDEHWKDRMYITRPTHATSMYFRRINRELQA